MMVAFADISNYNTVTNWSAYAAWSSIVAIKSSEGTGFIDPTFVTKRAGALAAGISTALYYHFGRPDLGNDPTAEAAYQASVVGQIRPGDWIVLDLEVNDPRATAEWAFQFLAAQANRYPGQVVLYASTAYIQERLQDTRLASFPLWLANWTGDASVRPACPAPWKSYLAWQYTDAATVPGISGSVDADLFFSGGTMIIPKGWGYNASTQTLTAPNNQSVHLGNAQFVLNVPGGWDPANVPLEAEHGTPGVPGTTQLFRDCQLAWTQQDDVHYAPLGQEYQSAQAQVSANVTQLTSKVGAALTQLSQDLAAAQAALKQS